MRISQVINALDRADAVSSCLLESDRMLRALGHETDIYFESAHASLASRGRRITELDPDRPDLVLFHYAGHSRILSRVARVRGKRGVIFHNVTPAHFFEGMPETYAFCQRAVGQLPTLPRLFDLGVGDSAFNTAALSDLGFVHTRVQPIAWEMSGLADTEPDASVTAKWNDGTLNLLMVARMAPHKGVLYAVAALPRIQEHLGRSVRLLLVGKTEGYAPYRARIEEAMRDTGMASQIVLAGEVSNPELRGYYQCADVLVQLSEHEGFCVPLVEAMAFGVPIVAAPAGAVAETLGGAGVLLGGRSAEEIARGVERAVREREVLVALGAERVKAFSRAAVQEKLEETIAWAANVPRSVVSAGAPRASVVVCTYNRAQVLGRCLDALRRQDYPEFEVVVVEGPSTDGTAEVLKRFVDVKRVRNPERNLSVSRNIGIAASVGDVVAFIDDDAVPEPRWLRSLVAAFDDPTVGAAGGDVFGPGGDHLQFSNGILSRSGFVVAHQDSPDDRNDPGDSWCNTLMGTNAAFRRDVLDEVGGFDENYEYYHDEADLCARVIDAGHRVEHRPAAVVWHGFEPGTSRRSAYDVDFTVVVKNTIYFSLGHNAWRRRPWRIAEPLPTIGRHVGWTLRRLLQRRFGIAHAGRLLAGWTRGAIQGYAKAFSTAPQTRLGFHATTASTFQPYAHGRPKNGKRLLHVVLLSQQYPPDECGGIGVYTEQLARGLASEGHRVSVIASGPAAIDERDGVEVYRVPREAAPTEIPYRLRVTRKNVAHSIAVAEVVSWLARTESVDVVESPIWDGEGYASSLAGGVPLVLRLNTPIALAAEMQRWEVGEDLDAAARLEWALLRRADAVVDPSGTILDTIASRYGVRPADVPIEEIPFGTPVPASCSVREEDDVRFLFVGRLERRKGADTLLRALPRVLDACPDAVFDFAGEGEGVFAPERLVASLSPEHRARVRFHGFVGKAARAELYERADVFVAPSRYESFGIVYLEAMAHACACVAGNAGGPTRIVLQGETGLLVDPEDPSALAAALVELANDPPRRRAMGATGRRRVEEGFTVDAMVRRTIDLYERVVADSAATSS